MSTLVLTMIADDRPGLVDALSGAIVAHGGSWQRSHMAQLAGKFAGIVVVDLPDDRTESLLAALAPLRGEGLLEVTAEVASGGQDDPAATRFSLHLVGQDRPGIVHEISRVLAEQRVSIDELQTATLSAPMSAEPLFEATAQLVLPATASLDAVRSSLESLADELMVDLDLSGDDRG